jgi:hypothetical protein
MMSKLLGVLIFAINFILLVYLKGKVMEMTKSDNNNNSIDSINNIDSNKIK